MDKIQFNFLVLAILVLGGCSWIGPQKSDQSFLSSDAYIQLIDSSLVQKGVTLRILPFRAGPGVEAGKDFDRMVFSLSRGLVQGFKTQSEYFYILEDQDNELADFILRGRIVALGTRSWFQKIFFRRFETSLKIEGEIIQSSNGKILVVFTENRRAKSHQQNYNDVAYLIGSNIATEILGKIQ